MPRYIDANRLIEFCLNNKSRTVDANDIARFPCTADVVERKHGKWNWVSFNIECSECGAMPNFDSTEPLYNFCPNCGADMREEKTDA